MRGDLKTVLKAYFRPWASGYGALLPWIMVSTDGEASFRLAGHDASMLPLDAPTRTPRQPI